MLLCVHHNTLFQVKRGYNRVLLNFWWWWWWLGVVDDVFHITAMPQCLTTKHDSLAHYGVP